MDAALRATINEVTPRLTTLRHDLHAHPELRFQEIWTADRLTHCLTEMRISHKCGYAGGTGIVAEIGPVGGKTVLLRADIDALEITEATGLPYASRVTNRMHACGHDGHTTCLMGAIRTLLTHQDRLKGRVRFVFQPGEEVSAGGRLMVQEGVLEDVDAAFALHAWPSLPVGSIGLKMGPAMAGADTFRITIEGVGGHAAEPASGIDPVLIAAHTITALHSIVSRQVAPSDPAVVTVTRIQAGSGTNIIPEEAVLEGTYRALSEEVLQHLSSAITRIATRTAEAFGGRATVQPVGAHYPPLVNDPDMTRYAGRIARDLFGDERVVEMQEPTMAAEDFSYYLQKVPGAFVFLGNGDPQDMAVSPRLHSPRFDFNDKAIPVGVELLATLALRFFDEG
jgi:hippurate hydrolase